LSKADVVMNFEVLHIGFSSMCNYLFVLGTGKIGIISAICIM